MFNWKMIREGLQTIEKGMTQIEDGIFHDEEDNEFNNFYWELMQAWGHLLTITYREGKLINDDNDWDDGEIVEHGSVFKKFTPDTESEEM